MKQPQVANHRALNGFAWTLIDLNIDLEEGVRYAEQEGKRRSRKRESGELKSANDRLGEIRESAGSRTHFEGRVNLKDSIRR